MKNMNNKRWKIRHIGQTSYEVEFKVDGDYFTKGKTVIDVARRGDSHIKLCDFTTSYYADTICEAAAAHCVEKIPGFRPSFW